jgi:hypothetical protein
MAKDAADLLHELSRGGVAAALLLAVVGRATVASASAGLATRLATVG